MRSYNNTQRLWWRIHGSANLANVGGTYLLGDNDEYELVDINKSHSVLRMINAYDSKSILPLINSDLTFSVLPKGFEKFQVISITLNSLRKEISNSIEAESKKQGEAFSDSSYD